MAENNSGDNIVSFLLGGVVGAAVALLLAPCSGEETRRRLGSWLEENRDKTKEFLEKERETILSKKSQVQAAWEAGKKAYRENAGGEA
jgi:gas vesicle protein